MDYGRLGERPRGPQIPILEIFSSLMLLAAIVLGMIELTRYSSTKDDLPTRLTIAGLPLGGLDENQAREQLDIVYVTQPIELSYQGSKILLSPAQIGFTPNADSMLAEARKQNSQEQDFWIGFWNYLVHEPVKQVTVPLEATYSERELKTFLEQLAQRYDTVSGQAHFDPATLTFVSGTPGTQLDIPHAALAIDAALRSPDPESRRVTLPVTEIGADAGSIDTLRQAIVDLMTARGFSYAGPETVGSVYIMDLATGEEVTIQPDVVYSAASTIKIPIMVNLFRQMLIVDQDPNVAFLLTASILCSDNSASNLLMQVAGGLEVTADANTMLGAGLNQVSCTAQELGAVRTFISAPIDLGDGGPRGEWPVCRPQVPTATSLPVTADPYSQTTARDLGMLLTEIYDCANSNTGLRAIYPDDITQTECQQMIEVLSGNRIDRLIELGVPQGTKVAHKNGWSYDTTGDAAIVFTPGGDYVISIFVYQPDTDVSYSVPIELWELIEEISRLTYNYFNPGAPLSQRREPLHPFTAIECVTVMAAEDVNLNDIDANRLDAEGNPLPSACFGGPGHCTEFIGW